MRCVKRTALNRVSFRENEILGCFSLSARVYLVACFVKTAEDSVVTVQSDVKRSQTLKSLESCGLLERCILFLLRRVAEKETLLVRHTFRSGDLAECYS